MIVGIVIEREDERLQNDIFSAESDFVTFIINTYSTDQPESLTIDTFGSGIKLAVNISLDNFLDLVHLINLLILFNVIL